jgi:predicted hydrocarbon binding protein
MAATVHALLPLSLLEAVRNVDTPQGDLEAEYVPELRNKRLGLSDTVYVQIRRFSEAVRRNQRTGFDDAAGLARLIGRRPDAEAVFRAAGRDMAREAYLTVDPVRRRALHAFPSLVVRPVALRTARHLARRYMNGSMTRVGPSVLLRVERPVTADAAPHGAGCAYYEAGLRELLRLLVGGAGAVEHVRCESREEGQCEWRAEWAH